MCKFPRLFALLLVALMAGSAFAATTITAVDSAAPIGKTGHTIDVTLVQNDGTLSNFQVDFSYDTSVLEITGATLQSGGAYTVFANQASGPSSYLFAASDFTGTGVPAGTQIQVSFTANVKGDATAGVSAITLTTGDNGSKGPDGAAGAVLNNGTFEALSFGLTTDAVGTLATTEAGAEATFDVTLNTEPTADVFVTVGSSDATEGTVSPTVLSFTTANWNVGQPVTVTGAEDELDDGDKAYEIFFIFDSSDTDYDTETNPDVASAPVAASNADDDTSAVLVAPAGSPSELGGQATLSVQLDAQPTDTVTITLSSDNPAEGVVTTPATKVLTFTTTDYNVAQTVIVTGINDDRDDGDTAFNIDFALTGNDAQYTALTPATQLTNIDDDDAGINATVSDSSTTEAGGNGSASISLKSEPFADVVFTFSSDDPTEGSVSNTTLTFTAVNWDQNQLVTVVGVNDDVADESVPYTLNVSIASNDGAYTALSFPTLGFANEDDDVAGIAVTLNQLTIAEDGGQDTFDVTLTSEPTGDVRVLVNSNSPLDATVNPAELTFTSENWDQGVPVTVTGVNDDIDRDDSATVALTVDNVITADSTYDDLNIPTNVAVTLTDDDSAGVTTSVVDTETEEDGTSITFDVSLNTKPTQSVQLTFSSADSSEGTVTTNATVTFTTDNWDQPVTVTITGADDSLLDDNQAYDVDYSLSTTDPAYSQVPGSSISLSNLDNEATRFELTNNPARADFSPVAGSSVPLWVTAFDVNGNPADYTGEQNLVFAGVVNSPNATAPTIDGTTVGQTTSVTFSSGIANITGVFPNAADFTLTVSDADDAAITQGSITGTSTPAAEDQLSFSDQPASDANIPGTPGNVGVSVLDAFGNLTASTETIDLQLVESGTTTTAAFTGTATQPAAAGTAAFSGLTVHERRRLRLPGHQFDGARLDSGSLRSVFHW